jgi:hypothetical protein
LGDSVTKYSSGITEDISSTLTVGNSHTLPPLIKLSCLICGACLVLTECRHGLIVIREVEVQAHGSMDAVANGLLSHVDDYGELWLEFLGQVAEAMALPVQQLGCMLHLPRIPCKTSVQKEPH